jgi:phosphatidylserine/phosphatidylglycerophosphate/cardiolipin synthase-like enzyme
MAIKVGDISVYLGPQEQGGADSLLPPLVEFIDNSKKKQKLMIAVQEIENEEIVHAIIRAKRRGVSIKVVIEQDYLLSDKIPDDPFLPGGTNERNRYYYNAILRSCIDVKSDYNVKIFHQKFMVLGNSVLTGSTNFTDTGVSKNLNHVVVINSAEVANAYKHEFGEIKKGRFGKNSVDREEKPREARVSGLRVKPLFAPDHGPEMEIMKQILKAKNRIDFAIFTFAQSSGIDDALITAREKGVQIIGVMDRRQANQKWAARHSLTQAGINLKLAGGTNGLGKLHHKLMVIDDSLTIFGSFNYTGPANKTNDENILIVGDLDATKAAEKNKQSKIAMKCREEIERIAHQFGTDV